MRRLDQRGLTPIHVIIIILALILLVLLGQCAANWINPGPSAVAVAGPGAMVPGQTGTFTVVLVLKGKRRSAMQYKFRIDEDDVVDDTLVNEVVVTVPAGSDVGMASFSLTCTNEGELQGANGLSEDETQHLIHAEMIEGGDVDSGNTPANCVVEEQPR